MSELCRRSFCTTFVKEPYSEFGSTREHSACTKYVIADLFHDVSLLGQTHMCVRKTTSEFIYNLKRSAYQKHHTASLQGFDCFINIPIHRPDP